MSYCLRLNVALPFSGNTTIDFTKVSCDDYDRSDQLEENLAHLVIRLWELWLSSLDFKVSYEIRDDYRQLEVGKCLSDTSIK